MCFNLHRHQVHLISYGCVSFSLITTGLVFTIFAIFQKDSQIGKVWLAGPTTMVVGLVLCGKVIIDWGPAMMHGRKGSLNSLNQLTLPVNGLMPYENYNSSVFKYDTQLKESQNAKNLYFENEQKNSIDPYGKNDSRKNSLNRYRTNSKNNKISTIIDFNGVTGLILPSTSFDKNTIMLLNKYQQADNSQRRSSFCNDLYTTYSNIKKSPLFYENNNVNFTPLNLKKYYVNSNDQINQEKLNKNLYNNMVDSSTQTCSAMFVSPIKLKNYCICNVNKLETFDQKINNLNRLVNILPQKVTIFQRNCMNCIKNCNNCNELNNRQFSKLNAIYTNNDKEIGTNYQSFNKYICNNNLCNLNNEFLSNLKELQTLPSIKSTSPLTINDANKSYQGETFVINKKSFFI